MVLRVTAAAALTLGISLAPIAASSASAAVSNEHSAKVAILQGANETAGGDADGIAIGVFRIRPADGQICYLLAAARLDGTVTAAHIHKAPAGSNGPVVVPLTPPVDGAVVACTTAAPALAADIVANPANYYANIHSSAFPGGAVRGQLRG
jgi:hypothetical protein